MKETFRKIIAEFDKRIETQLKVMAGLGDEIYRYGYGKSLEAYQQGKLIVEIAADEFNNGWIPCSERLPEEPKENPILDYKPLELYLVSVEGADYSFRAFWNGEIFFDGFSKLENVIAWQPLPEVYKKQVG